MKARSKAICAKTSRCTSSGSLTFSPIADCATGATCPLAASAPTPTRAPARARVRAQSQARRKRRRRPNGEARAEAGIGQGCQEQKVQEARAQERSLWIG